MFNIFQKKCPTCKMELEAGKKYPEANGQEFCSESCKEEYSKKPKQEQSKSSGGCCH